MIGVINYKYFKYFLAKPGCGGQSSENITYLDSASAKLSSYPGACTYSICPKSADICRIRFDFEVNFLKILTSS